MPVQAVAENINFSREEEKIIQLWKDIDAFKTSLKQSKNKPRYTFYDGPPFATGLPHYGHILAGTVKDVVTRWAHQSGFHVDRRFGWDCHGLPVEYEIDKTLGIKGPEDVAKMGIENYNAECRKIVSRYATEWETIVGRLGRWIDFRNDYKTMYPWFMESIWWNFKQLYDKGLVYRGAKVMPFSSACNTPLSNFEAGQNYKDVDDPAVIVSFPLVDEPEVKVLAWTTTPWTLPSNLTLCVHPELDYVKVKDASKGNIYIMMEARLTALFKSEKEYKVLQKFKGKTLEGKSYTPIFDYFEYMREKGAFRILNDGYVTSESGTGIVHQAPYFGEDDYRCNLNYNIITKDMDPLCPVDMCGRFTLPVRDFEGQYVKDADKNIIKMLKENGRLIHQGTVNHSYPFCWRSDTPLIYRAVPSWFVRVEHMQQKLLESNSQTHWVPDFVKEKRFGNWLRDARDWAISRNRYWGTPIPLWTSDDGQEVVCVGSIQELKELTGRDDITDIHREFVDKLTIPSKMGKGELKRVSEVFDCWFESGSMPYAQAHFPFENKREFEDGFPGDFIAEGIDQTRGWFYTLLVLSTALFGKAPFKNLICHGLVLAADGQKMSKRKKNYPDPMDIVNSYGADAVRLYLINSPVVRADNLKFKEQGVRDVLKDVFLPWFNAYRFLMQNINRLEVEEGEEFVFSEGQVIEANNYMDRWVISFTQTLIKFVKQEMAAYRLYTVVPRLVKFVEQLTNWYVRMNRKRLKGDGGLEDCQKALQTLFGVLFSMTKVMAPFIPFLTEHMYQNMKDVVKSDRPKSETESVHYLMLPTANEDLMDPKIELAVSRMQTVIELARVVRDRKTMPMKYPLSEVVIIHQDLSVREDVKALEHYIKEELNVRSVTVSQDKVKYGVQLQATPDFKALGVRLKNDLKQVMAAMKNLSDSDLEAFQKSGSLKICGHTLETEDLKLSYTAKNESSSYEAHSDGDILILLDVTPDQSMLDEGLAREVINRVQKLRKKAKLSPSDDISIYYTATGVLPRIISQQYAFIQQTVKQPMTKGDQLLGAEVIISDSMKIKDDTLKLTFVRGHQMGGEGAAAGASPPPAGEPPVCSFVNVMLHRKIGAQNNTQMGTVLLENPKGERVLEPKQLAKEIQMLFGIQSQPLYFLSSSGKTQELTKATIESARQGWLQVAVSENSNPASTVPQSSSSVPCCMYINVITENNKKKRAATILLENPRSQFLMQGSDLEQQVALVFGVDPARQVALYEQPDRKGKLSTNGDIRSLHGRTVYLEV